MKQFLINVCYREQGNSSAKIQEMCIVAHSIQDAKSAFALWQRQTQNWTNAKPPLYKMISATKLGEIKESEEKKAWLRLNPDRAKSQIYVCPYCQETCYAPSQGCNYQYCPRCGTEVI